MVRRQPFVEVTCPVILDANLFRAQAGRSLGHLVAALLPVDPSRSPSRAVLSHP